jgi:hypothetical protein
MPRTLITAFATVVAAFAVAAPAAMADTTQYPVTIGDHDGKITFTYHDPDPNSSAAVLIDTNDDGKSDMDIEGYLADGGSGPNFMVANFNDTPASTESCQEISGRGAEHAVSVQDLGSGNIQLSVDGSELPRNFTAKVVGNGFSSNYNSTYCHTEEYDGATATMLDALRFGAPAPANLQAVAADGQVTVTFDPVADAERYDVYVNGTMYPNTPSGYTFNLPNDTPERFEVAAVRANVEGVISQSVTVTPTAPPVVPVAVPANLQAVAADWGVMLSWDPVAGADHYEIYADGTALQWVDAGAAHVFIQTTAAKTYRFEVTAGRGLQESAPSASVYATPRTPAIVNPPVDTQPPVSPQPPAGPQAPAHPADPDGDGIRNDWLIAGRPAPAPARPTARTLTSTSVTVKLPKAPKGTTLAVYVRAAGGAFARVTGTPNARGQLTIKRLKRNTTYELELVEVKAGKQSAASKLLKVKTKTK